MRLLVEAISCLPKGEESNQADDPSITLAIAPSESVLTLTQGIHPAEPPRIFAGRYPLQPWVRGQRGSRANAAGTAAYSLF